MIDPKLMWEDDQSPPDFSLLLRSMIKKVREKVGIDLLTVGSMKPCRWKFSIWNLGYGAQLFLNKFHPIS